MPTTTANNNTLNSLSLHSLVHSDEHNKNKGGAFPALMESARQYIIEEHKERRLTGKEYATVLLGMMQTVLTESVKWALSKELADADVALRVAQKESVRIVNGELLATTIAKRKLVEAELAIQQFTLLSVLPLQQTKTQAEINLVNSQKILSDGKGLTEAQTTLNTREEIARTVANTALTNQQVALTGQKILTEVQTTETTREQIILYRNQAIAFKKKHNRDLAVEMMGASTMAFSQSAPVTSTTQIFGETVQTALIAARW